MTSGSWNTSQNLSKQGNQQGISNIQFFKCDTPTNNDKVVLKIKKIAVDGNSPLQGPWSFTFTSPQLGSFPLTDTASESVAFQLNPGATIEITENDPAGFNLKHFTCSNISGTPVQSQSYDAAVRKLTLTISANASNGDEIHCTAENKKENVGLLSLEKVVVGNGAESDKSFQFSVSPLSNGTFPISQDSSPKVFEITNNNVDVTISETDPSSLGYSLASVSCSKNGGSFPVDLQNGSISFKAGKNDNISCTFTNRKDTVPEKGKIAVKKIVKNPDDSIATNDPQTFDFNVAGTPVGPLGNGDTSVPVEVDLDGTYAVSETLNSDYDLIYIDCGNGAHTSGTNSINVTPTTNNKEITCEFFNRRKGGSIKVVKETIGGNDQFDFSIQGPLSQDFQLEGGENKLFTNVSIGDYTITEKDLPNDWKLQDVDCTGVNATRTDDKIEFTLNDQDSAICTFVNFKETDDPGEDVTKLYIHRRVDNLLSHGPDRARILRRLDEQPTGSLKDGGSYEPLKLAGSVKDGNTDVQFSTSLSQIRAAAASAASKKISDAGLSFNDSYSGYTPYGLAQRLDLWVEGQISRYDDATGGIERDGTFGILYVGMDYALAPGVLIGGIVQFDRTKESLDDPDITGSVEGKGWMAGPYLGVKLRDDLFFDARAAWGKSSNDINLTDNIVGNRTGSFDTDRWLATASLTGNYLYGDLRISPQVSVEYGNEISDDYFMSNLQKVNSVDVTIGRLTFGPEFGRKYQYENGTTIEPHMSVKGIWTFEGDELELSTGTVQFDQLRASVEGGVIVRSPDGYAFRAAGSYDGIGDEDLEAWSAKLWLNIPLN